MRLKRMHVALLAVVLVAAACGSGGEGSSAPAPAPAAPTQGADHSDPAEEVLPAYGSLISVVPIAVGAVAFSAAKRVGFRA
jgi:ABC-type glycerol-3-phosphate transport system substrate-binding protein